MAAITIAAVTAFTGTAKASDWEYTIAPYVWGPQFETTLNIGPNPPVSDSTSIFDILNSAFLIAGEARNRRWSIGGEFNYLNLGDDISVGRLENIASWELDGTMISLAAGYAAFEDDRSRLEAFGGLRHWDLELSTTVRGFTASIDRDWTDPVIGARYSRALGERWSVAAMGNVGGFSVGSKFQWEALVQANWKWTDTVSVAGGYRHLKVDFEDDNSVVDLLLTGPYVALAFNF